MIGDMQQGSICFGGWALAIMACGFSGWAGAEEPRVRADHPGGNIRVLQVKGGEVHLATDLRHLPQGQSWFYWNFRPADGKGFRAVFFERNHIGVNGPAVSHDGGATWEWMGRDRVLEQEHPDDPKRRIWSFEVAPTDDPGSVRYSFAPQYLQTHLESWLASHRDDDRLRLTELTKSRKGRSVERIDIGDSPDRAGSIVLIARQHCCETMGTYVLEGFLEAALADDETGAYLREQGVTAIPFMDKDGVEEGDQGKNRAPHDHNRDYNEQPIYPEVRALMDHIRRHREDISVFFDLHCPTVHGEWDNKLYLVGSSLPSVAEAQKAFMPVLAASCRGPVKVREEDLLVFGMAWNTNANFSQGKNSGRWVGETLASPTLVSTIEMPYANSRGVPVTADSARAFGRDLALAVSRLER